MQSIQVDFLERKRTPQYFYFILRWIQKILILVIKETQYTVKDLRRLKTLAERKYSRPYKHKQMKPFRVHFMWEIRNLNSRNTRGWHLKGHLATHGAPYKIRLELKQPLTKDRYQRRGYARHINRDQGPCKANTAAPNPITTDHHSTRCSMITTTTILAHY